MKKENWFVVVGVLLFVVGIIVLFNGTNIGIDIANKALHANGGSMDTEMYHFIMKSSALSYQIGGGIFAFIGGASTIIFGQKRRSNQNSQGCERIT